MHSTMTPLASVFDLHPAISGLWASWRLIFDVILRALFFGKVAQVSAKVGHGGVVIHIPQARGAIIAAGENQFPIWRKNYIFHARGVAGKTTKFLTGFGIP